MQEKRYPGTLQGDQHTQNSIGQLQGQGSQSQPDRDHIPIPMSTHQLFQLIHWGIWQIPGRKGQRTLKGPLPIHLHSATSGHPLDPNQFKIVHKEVNSQSRTIKEAMFICIQDPPSTGIWASTSCCTYGTSSYIHHQCSSANQHNSQPSQPTHKPPTGTPFLPPSITTYLSHYPFRWGQHTFSYYYSYW